ncbi:hypothetical protein pf16_231 [Pseudomonas phage pf16]|uniref:Uncharacterized protein n=1 Tax=Pseudomonas phage pf16 TaxID=1815630 RepID=A0A1S5R496_9CAUD|nr:hypothetical protein FDG98_gp067 [Pseudomonas phage pf16]AND75154.1 hypothetical protein pf16_231 [Pseudomonas phage pf16]
MKPMNTTQFPQKKSTQNLADDGVLIVTGWNECVDALNQYLSGSEPALWVHPAYLVRRQGVAPMAIDATLNQIAPAQIPLFRAPCQQGDPIGSFDKHMEYMRRNVDLINENNKLRALLEEALGSVHSDAGRCESSTLHAELIDLGDRITAFLAPKYCECPPGTDRCITQGGHFPACTACKRRIK